jgi:two-component system, OmpR family, sensor histidine kinase BaeS
MGGVERRRPARGRDAARTPGSARTPRGPARSGRLPLRRSLLGRLLAVSALVAVCSVAATAWLAARTTSGAIRQEQGRNLADDARIYQTLLGHAATHPQWNGVGATVHRLADRYDRRIALTTRAGRPIADSAAPADGSAPPALPAGRSAVVDPLSTDTAFDPLAHSGNSTGATTGNGTAADTGRAADGDEEGRRTAGGQGGKAAGGGSAPAAAEYADGTDRIDPRAVGPFRLPAAERAALRRTASSAVACLRDMGLDPEIVTSPTGRPRLHIPGSELTGQLPPCRQLFLLGEPTATERAALTALNKLSDACLSRRGHRPVRLALDPASPGGAGVMPVRTAGPITLAPAPAGDGIIRVRPGPESPGGPARAAERLGERPEDRSVDACVETARRELLGTHVSAPALLFIGNPDVATVPGFDLSPRSTAEIAGVATLVLALTVGASVLAATRLVRPLRALTGAAQRMKDGGSAEPVPVRGDSEVGRLAAAFNDMAAHRARLESQRRELVGDVAHELRTPLSNIRAWLEGAQDGLADLDDAFVSSLLEEAVQLQHIIDDLQDLAQADAGALRLALGPVPPAELLAQVAAAHQGRADTAGITLTAAADEGVPELYADPVRLRQAIGNLVANALRHTPRGGRVELRARCAGGGRAVVFEVADTGPGIPPEDLPQVFERFWRADKSRSRRTGGSGLGLSIVRKLAEVHGGTAGAASTPGQGSVFTVTLPADGPPTAHPAAGTVAGGAVSTGG